MALADTNTIIRAYLFTQSSLTTLIGSTSPRICCPKLTEGCTLPAISFLTRGGPSIPDVRGTVHPSVQFSCWADNPIAARQAYSALYNSLHGIKLVPVTVGIHAYTILESQEEVQGQDMQDPDAPNYYKVLAFFSMLIQAI